MLGGEEHDWGSTLDWYEKEKVGKRLRHHTLCVHNDVYSDPTLGIYKYLLH